MIIRRTFLYIRHLRGLPRREDFWKVVREWRVSKDFLLIEHNFENLPHTAYFERIF